MSKNKKILISAISAVMLLACIGGFAWKVQANRAVKAIDDRVNKIQKEVSLLYTDKNKEMLAEDVSEQGLAKVDKLIKAEEGQEMSEEAAGKLSTAIIDLSDAKQMFGLKMATAALLDEDQVLAENADVEAAEAQANELQAKKPVFVESQMMVINEAKEQMVAIAEATTTMNDLFIDDTVKDGVTRDLYHDALSLVNNLKQEKAREMLLLLAAQVDTSLSAKEEAQRLAEEAAQAALAQATNHSSANGSGGSGKGSSSGNGSKGSGNGSKGSGGNGSSGSKGSNSKPSGSGNSGNGGSSNSGGSNGMKPGDSWDADKDYGGELDGGGGSWGTIKW